MSHIHLIHRAVEHTAKYVFRAKLTVRVHVLDIQDIAVVEESWIFGRLGLEGDVVAKIGSWGRDGSAGGIVHGFLDAGHDAVPIGFSTTNGR